MAEARTETVNDHGVEKTTVHLPAEAAVGNSALDEKAHDLKVDMHEVEEELDLYRPLKMSETIQYEPHILTFRAIVVGICLGCLVTASNLYLGKPIYL
jgi:hypothetical protein